MNTGFDDGRRRRRRGVATVIAFATLILAPLLAGALTSGSPAALISLPAESIAVVLVLLSLGGGPLRWIVAAVFGAVVVAGTVVAALNLGFESTIDRDFSLAQDGPAIVSAFEVVGDATGSVNAVLILALAVGLLVGAAFALARAALRAERVTTRSGRSGRVAVAAVTATWILCALVGAQLLPGVPVASADPTSALARTSAQTAMSIREEAAFQRSLRSDPYRGVPPAQLVSTLEGRDVVIAFLESYGRVAVQDSTFSAGVDRVLDEGGDQLARDGYAARSAFLTSPTFGGVSWLAHATLQSGRWVDSQQKYDRLMSTDQLTLTAAFHEAGWRTVSVVPSNREAWTLGEEFYGYDTMVNSRNMGYRGPIFSYARVPDQYTWWHFYQRELATPHEPVMAEIDFVSSHTPWTPLPRLVPWSQLGDGTVFDPQPAEGLTPVEAWSDPKQVRRLYGESVEYTLGAMFSFLHEFDQPNLVLIVVGDHQPARIVSGPDADRDVPITIISKDPSVLAAIDSWEWDAGVHPSPDAPVWRMDAFRDRFFDAFGG